jgi:hypothetical protein
VIRRHSLLIASVAFLLACLCCYRSMHSAVHASTSAEQISKQLVSVHSVGPKAALWHIHHAVSIKLTSKNSSSNVRIPHNSWFAYKRVEPNQVQQISSSYVERRIWLINRAILI